MSTQRVSSGAPWERQVGYCRAVRRGSFVAVAGTTAVDAEGNVVGVGDAYAQAQHCLSIIRAALEEAGADISDVIRTRVFLVNVDDWPEVGRAHAEVFAEYPPASTMLEAGRLINPELLVEIEADAIISS